MLECVLLMMILLELTAIITMLIYAYKRKTISKQKAEKTK